MREIFRISVNNKNGETVSFPEMIMMDNQPIYNEFDTYKSAKIVIQNTTSGFYQIHKLYYVENKPIKRFKKGDKVEIDSTLYSKPPILTRGTAYLVQETFLGENTNSQLVQIRNNLGHIETINSIYLRLHE